jgi:hypothetical protein
VSIPSNSQGTVNIKITAWEFPKVDLWHSGKAVADHEVMAHGFKSWKQALAEMQGKTTYIRPIVIGPFSGPCASGSYVHRTTLLLLENFQTLPN